MKLLESIGEKLRDNGLATFLSLWHQKAQTAKEKWISGTASN